MAPSDQFITFADKDTILPALQAGAPLECRTGGEPGHVLAESSVDPLR